MNYIKHYSLLVNRGKNRNLKIYTESHHIIPVCLKGTNNKQNLVNLTPEEHYLAHLLLTKIYPESSGLVLAAAMMTCNSPNTKRFNNKLYGWLRRKHSAIMKLSQSGKGNSQYGTCWISNISLKASKKIKINELSLYLDSGWIKKRIQDWNLNIEQKCLICNTIISEQLKRKYCSKKCRTNSSNYSYKLEKFNNKLDEMIVNCNKGISITKSLKMAGFCGTGAAHGRLTKILDGRQTGKVTCL